MSAPTRLFLLIVLLGIVPGPNARADSLDAVLDRLVAEYGGAANLRKVDAMVQEWDLVAVAGNRHGSDRRSVLVPGRLKVELTYPDKTETRLLSGEAGYVVFGDLPAARARPMQTDAMRLQLMRLYSPLALRERAADLQLTPGRRSVVLTLRDGGLSTHYHVSRETWRIERVVGMLEIGGTQMHFVTEYSDFARVDGVLVHRRENKFAGGTHTAVLRLRKIEFGVAFDAAEFAPPGQLEAGDIRT